MTLEDRREAYKSFFLKTEAGKAYVQTLQKILDGNVAEAQNKNSLDHLSRSKGNREALELITNVLATEKEVKPN